MCTAIPLHWMISDNKCSIVAEPLKDGLRIYDNPFEVLTNNSPFEYTHYSSCCNADSGIYDYTTYTSSKSEQSICTTRI